MLFVEDLSRNVYFSLTLTPDMKLNSQILPFVRKENLRGYP